MVEAQRRQVKEYLAESDEDLARAAEDAPMRPTDTPASSTSGAFLRPPSVNHVHSRSAPGVGRALNKGASACGSEEAEFAPGTPLVGPASAPAVAGHEVSAGDNGIEVLPSPQPSTSRAGTEVDGGARRKSRKRSDQVG